MLIRLLFTAVVIFPGAAHGTCKIFYATKSELNQVRSSQEDIRSLSRALNSAIKTSFDFLNKIDRMTLGLASAILLGGHSLEDLQPSQWNKIQVTGTLLFQDQPFNVVAIRGAKMTFSADGKKQELTTGTQGEFAGYFYELVPYTRIRLFPGLTIVRREGIQPTLKMPLKLKVESKICNAETTIDYVPLEPVSVIATMEPDK